MTNISSGSEKEQFNKRAFHPLQSWEWGEFRKIWGNKVVRKNNLQIIFSYIPKTPWKIGTVIKGPSPTKEMLENLKKIGKDEKAIFIKLEPNVLINEKDVNLLKRYCVSGKRLFTLTSFWIDLTKSEEELLTNFTPKTRYNIKLAQKRGVTVKEDNSDIAFEKYLALTRETTQRQNFFAHTEKYHRDMWNILNKAKIAHLLTATYQGEIITTWILFSWHDFLYYPYGASTEKYKNVMANNLMMWEAIRLGKGLGLKTFDLWGREEGKGFTKFKEGYNPKVVKFLGSWDLIISPIYYLYRIAEFIRWLFLRIPAKLGLIKTSF